MNYFTYERDAASTKRVFSAIVASDISSGEPEIGDSKTDMSNVARVLPHSPFLGSSSSSLSKVIASVNAECIGKVSSTNLATHHADIKDHFGRFSFLTFFWCWFLILEACTLSWIFLEGKLGSNTTASHATFVFRL